MIQARKLKVLVEKLVVVKSRDLQCQAGGAGGETSLMNEIIELKLLVISCNSKGRCKEMAG